MNVERAIPYSVDPCLTCPKTLQKKGVQEAHPDEVMRVIKNSPLPEGRTCSGACNYSQKTGTVDIDGKPYGGLVTPQQYTEMIEAATSGQELPEFLTKLQPFTPCESRTIPLKPKNISTTTVNFLE